MPAQFKDTVYVDGGIQQLGTYFIYNDVIDTDAGYSLYIITSVPCQSYVMIMVEVSGYVSNNQAGGFFADGNSTVKQAWNFYTYSYMIGNVNSTRKVQGIVTMDPPFCYDAVSVGLTGYLADRQLLGLVVDVYATAGNGYRYPVTVEQVYLSKIT
jgi:hypothetical protein